MYILRGFPTTETDAAQFLEENNAYYMKPTNKRKSAANPPPKVKPCDRAPFLSSLDAVVQLTTRYAQRKEEEGNQYARNIFVVGEHLLSATYSIFAKPCRG